MFNFENTIEQIPIAKTKEYFKEVYSSYCIGNYRSAVVMLWTVIVCDLLFKLQYLRDVYNDLKAIDILAEVEKKHKQNNKSPEWEHFLLDEVFKRTAFLNNYDKQNLDQILDNRNLCAHPIVSDGKLLQPTQERVRDLLRSALESILIKKPLLTSNIINTLLTDLSEKKDSIKGYENIEAYLKSRYFSNFGPQITASLLSCLWKMVINPRSTPEIENQQVNFYALYALFGTFPDQCMSIISENAQKYSSHISQTTNEFGLDCAIQLCKQNKKLYTFLTSDACLIIKSRILQPRNLGLLQQDFPLNRYFDCYFLSTSLEEHMSSISEMSNHYDLRPSKINQSTLDFLYSETKKDGTLSTFFNMCISIYSKSVSFDDADIKFTKFIRPYMYEFSKNDMLNLIKKSSLNSQTYNRRSAIIDHKEALKICLDNGYITDDIISDSAWGTPYQQLLK